VKLLRNYYIAEAKFAIFMTIAALLQNYCLQINIKMEELYF